VRQLQILTHQAKTPTKVDVFVATYDGGPEVPAYHQAQFRKLGYLTFHNNEHNKYRNRERKTVQMKERICYLRLVLHNCHMNPLNLYNQVSVIQVLAFGDVLVPFATRSGHQGPQHHSQKLPPLKARNNTYHDARGDDGADDENVYALVGGDGGGGQQRRDPHDPTPRQGGKHVVLPPISQSPPRRQPQPAAVPPAPTDDYDPQYDAGYPPQQQQYTYQQQQPQQQYDPSGYPQAAPQSYQQQPAPAPALEAQQAGAMNGLVHYRSSAILDFEDLYITKTTTLTAKKAQAVEIEDFDSAKSCKEQLEFLQSNAEKIYDLEGQKVRCIFEEDFDSAKRVKVQMDRLINFTRSGIEAAQKGKPNALRGQPGPNDDHAAAPADSGHDHPHHGKHRGRRRASHTDDAHADDEEEPPRPPPPTDVPSFDEVPVMSKYAQQMAEQAKLKRGSKAGVDEDEDAADADASRDDGDGDDEDAGNDGDDGDGAEDEEAEDDAEAEEEEDEEDEEHSDGDGDESDANVTPVRKQGGGKSHQHSATPPPPPARGSQPRPKRVHERSESSGAPPPAAPHNEDTQIASIAGPPITGFDVETFDEWERDVYFAIQDEASRDANTNEAPADPLETTEGMTDFFSNFGKYATACLFSRRWRLREAAVRIITQFFDTMFKHAIPVNAANAMLNYLDTKGFGLLDSIQTAFISSCEFLTRLVDDKLGGVELASVQPHVQSLLPRLFLRASDTTTKTREEALCTIFVLANSPIGPERVAAAALADPLDQDKRRMPTQNHRTYLCRLLVMQQLLNSHGLSRTISVDALMSKLLLLCLNHQHNEVRDLAVVVTGCIDTSKGQDIMRHLPSVRNPATRAVIEERLAFPGQDDAAEDGEDPTSGDEGRPPNHKSPGAAGGKPPARTKSAKRRPAAAASA
jgi:hypothetical protein